MKIEEEVFLKKEIDTGKLALYGFKEKDGEFFYSETFPGGEFRADITVTAEGKLSGRVMDIMAEEEYLPVHIESRYGPFVAEVRANYRAILEKIADKCCIKQPFICDQTNRIAKMIKDRYGELPDYPFKKLPDCAVFRYPPNRKWYGLIMYTEISLIKKDGSRNGEKCETLNVKTDPEKAGEILKIPGIYPGYHMNRKNWISIILDGTVEDEVVMRLIDISRNYAVGTGGIRETSDTGWIIPANPAYCDLDALFSKKRGIIWTQRSHVKKGDTVFIYVGAPVSAVIYRCAVIECDIPYGYSDDNISISKVMKLDLVKTYPGDLYTREKLKELGIKSVRGARRITKAFAEAVKDEE